MVVPFRYFIYFILCRKYLTLKIRRNEKFDAVESVGNFDCSSIDATASSGGCACPSRSPTLVSLNNSMVRCHRSNDFQCRISLLERYDATTPNNRSPATSKQVPVGLRPGCTSIEAAYVWRLLNDRGMWIDMSKIGSEMFSLASVNKSTITTNSSMIPTNSSMITNNRSIMLSDSLNFTKWEGSVVMLKFNCADCILLKFLGTIEYPVYNHTLTFRFPPRKPRRGSELSTASIAMIIVATCILLLLVSVMCIFRQKLSSCKGEQSSWSSKRNYSGNINATTDISPDPYVEIPDSKDPNDPWYEINKLSGLAANNTRHSRKPSGDSFYIPTIREFFRERNSRGKNVYDMNFTQDPDLSVQQQNPYQESAS